jgi:crotonobetainyl-CoA:carnitine CoA-transferase CaiB-like acyl-CoA transferase
VVPNQRQWPAFCRIVGHDDWIDDPRFATPMARVQNAAIIYPQLREDFRRRTCDEWERELTEATIACGPINDLAEVFALDQVKHRKLVETYTVEGVGPVPALALPFRFSQTPASITGRPPRLGEHTVDILRELGLDDDKIQSLLDEGTVRQHGGRQHDVVRQP